jgi:hypothetical protein
VLYESWDRIPHESRPGDTVTIDWRDGVFTVNGFIHRPHTPPPPWKVEMLRKLYGNVPFVIEYVAKADGDSIARWNAASKAQEKMHIEIYNEAIRVYLAALDSLNSVEKALQLAASRVAQSEHVASARPDSPDTCCDEGPMIAVSWKGLSEEFVAVKRPFNPRPDYKDREPSRDDACRIVNYMWDAFGRAGTYRVEFVRGNVNMFGSAGMQYMEGGSPSTDPRYHDNPYVEVPPAATRGAP